MEANGIVLSPDPRLRQECAVIEEITPAIEALAEKMKKMMFENVPRRWPLPAVLPCRLRGS